MARDPEGLVTFEAAGKRFTAVFGFRAMKAVETYYDLPFFQALQKIMPDLAPEDAKDESKIMAAGASVRVSDVGRLFGFVLLKHHPDLTEDEIDDMIDEVELANVGAIIGSAIASGLVSGKAEKGGGRSTGNPPPSRRKSTG